jgi:hypothetical protein
MKLRGFTPVFDSLVAKHGATVALVYGKIWRYCDWSELGVCTASNKRLAEELDLSESTIKRTKQFLAEEGYINVVGKSGRTDTVTVVHTAVMSMDIEDGDAEPLPPEPKRKVKTEKRGDLVDAILDYNAEEDVSWIWPENFEKIKAIPSRYRNRLSDGQKMRWNTHVTQEWAKYTADEVARAIELHMDGGLAFGGPWSIDWAFMNLDATPDELEKRRKELYGD